MIPSRLANMHIRRIIMRKYLFIYYINFFRVTWACGKLIMCVFIFSFPHATFCYYAADVRPCSSYSDRVCLYKYICAYATCLRVLHPCLAMRLTACLWKQLYEWSRDVSEVSPSHFSAPKTSLKTKKNYFFNSIQSFSVLRWNNFADKLDLIYALPLCFISRIC